MTLRNILIPAGLAALVYVAWRSLGYPGVLAVAGGIVMWLLLHFTRLMAIMRRAARRPIGYVDSAIMLNTRLRCGQTLLHVVALTRALGEQIDGNGEGSDPATYRWTDNGGISVTCEFRGGRLTQWDMQRPSNGNSHSHDNDPSPGTLPPPANA